jgi:acyl-CoA thioesterase I
LAEETLDMAPLETATPPRAFFFPTTLAGGLWDAARAILLCAAVVASLLTFPSAIPWLIAGWLVWYTVLVLRGRWAGFPLAACLVILLVKQVFWTPGLLALAVVMGMVGIWQAVGRARGKRGRLTYGWVAVLAVWGAWAVMVWGWQSAAHCRHPVEMQGMRPVVCMGDSLTSGVSWKSGYPNLLREQIALPVLDFSRPGITIRDGLTHLPEIIRTNPQVVIVELGGHDYMRGRTRAQTKESLEQIILACREIGAEIILLEIPRGFITDPYAGLERELAFEYDIELIPDTAIRKLVLRSPAVPRGVWTVRPDLSDDGLHPNEHGNEMLAEYVARALERMYGPAIRAKDGQ